MLRRRHKAVDLGQCRLHEQQLLVPARLNPPSHCFLLFITDFRWNSQDFITAVLPAHAPPAGSSVYVDSIIPSVYYCNI